MFAKNDDKLSETMVKRRSLKNTNRLSLENVGIYSFEIFCVAELLREKDHITFEGSANVDGFPFSPDLYSEIGIPSLELEGPTIIEIKKTLSYATVQEVQALYDMHRYKYNIVVIYFDSTVTNIPKDTEQNTHEKKLLYISFDTLNNKKRSVKKQKAFFAKRAERDWKEERRDIIKKAQEMIAQENNILFLGAGVSMSAKMPSWKDLLKGLMGEVKQLKSPTLEAFKELSSHILEECGDSNLIMGRYLQTAISLHDDKAVFSELIQKYLYNTNYTSPLLKKLAHIVKQKKVCGVITYNFDDLLEQNLSELGLKDSLDYTAISKDAEIKGHNTLPIYHVHGIIPKVGPVDTVVFSEEEYHRRYSTAYHWSNVEQLHALSRMHCFFVGLSMTDPNLRRLLDAAKEMNKSNGINHYAFLQRKKLENYCISDVNKTCRYVHVTGSLIDTSKQKEIYNLNYTVIESIFLDLGVNIIWYEDHNELPNLIAQVFNITQYEDIDTKELITRSENGINEIIHIESQIQDNKNNVVPFLDMYKKAQYIKDNASIYKALISELYNLLSELSNRVKWDNISDDKINELQVKSNQYSNTSFYGNFFKIWLDSLKELFV